MKMVRKSVEHLGTGDLQKQKPKHNKKKKKRGNIKFSPKKKTFRSPEGKCLLHLWLKPRL